MRPAFFLFGLSLVVALAGYAQPARADRLLVWSVSGPGQDV
jgi:hypothetical protein